MLNNAEHLHQTTRLHWWYFSLELRREPDKWYSRYMLYFNCTIIMYIIREPGTRHVVLEIHAIL